MYNDNDTDLSGLVLIPAFNEARKVASVVRKALEYLPVLVVDDGSTDGTTWQAQSAGAEVLARQRNQGKGAALQSGLKVAREKGYGVVITLDADGQHDPSEIPLFLKAHKETHADLIIGRRDFTSMPLIRRLSNTLGRRIFSWAVGIPIPDNQCGYRLLSRRLIRELHHPGERGYEFEVEMIVHCLSLGYRIEWVPIRTIYADEKSHINPLKHTIKFIQIALRTRRLVQASHRTGEILSFPS